MLHLLGSATRSARAASKVHPPPSALAILPLMYVGAAAADVDSLHACKAVLDALQAQLMLVRGERERGRAGGVCPREPRGVSAWAGAGKACGRAGQPHASSRERARDDARRIRP